MKLNLTHLSHSWVSPGQLAPNVLMVVMLMLLQMRATLDRKLPRSSKNVDVAMPGLCRQPTLYT